MSDSSDCRCGISVISEMGDPVWRWWSRRRSHEVMGTTSAVMRMRLYGAVVILSQARLRSFPM